MNDYLPRQWSLRAWPAIIAGLFWLCGDAGGWSLLLGLLPGVLLLASGVALLLWPGEDRITQYMGLGAVIGVVLAIPALLFIGLWFGLLAALLSIVSYLCAGRMSLLYAGLPASVPTPPLNWRTDAKVALDEALVGYFVSTARLPNGDAAQAACEQTDRIERLMQTADWGRPDSFHSTPSAPQDVEVKSARAVGHDFQLVEFASDYAPPTDLPGLPAWLNAPQNARCQSRVFRQSQAGRPWLLGLHGYRMGAAWIDLRLFQPKTLVDKLGYNLVLPALPLHGARRVGRRSGDHFLDGDPVDLLYAEAQTLWDLRRTLAWIRTQEPEARIGVLGYSLGGYNAALLAAYEPELDFVVAGVPIADFAPMLWQHLPLAHQRYFAAHDLNPARYADLLKVVSPLASKPQLPRERLAIFAGSADRVVPPEQPLLLSEHWQVPVHWFPGGHLTFRGESVVTDTLRHVAEVAGWTSSASAPASAPTTAPTTDDAA